MWTLYLSSGDHRRGRKGDAMPSSDWRSPAAYGHAERIAAAGFAWEYLRRHDAYRRDFRRMKAQPRGETPTRTAFAERWGLRFPG
ncbi:MULTISPECIES: transcriptional regulator domain-containing protein [Pseudomonadota]|uniref:transcriptional regulator domain-containing protein n=1 Tax=Pseudomonadota TaxID=1224 RepID=UPI001910E1A3|nr:MULTISPECIES: DUF6499 domain-containing protein [Pseudomonadota]